jgi:hypothetical protein
LLIGVSDEEESLIQDVFLTKLGSKHPWVRIKQSVDTLYGITGFPTVLVIDASGTVVQKGMPSEATLEQLLKDVSLAPKMPDEPRFAPLRAAWEKTEYLKVRDLLAKLAADPKLDEATKTLVTAQQEELQKRTDRVLARIEELGASTDFAMADEKLERIVATWRGLPPADAAKKALAGIAANPAAKKELAAAKSLAKLRTQFDPSRISQRRKLVEELAKFAKKHEGTKAAAEALAESERLGR